MTIRMQEADFLRDPVQVMAYVERGDVVCVERNGHEIAVLHEPKRLAEPAVRPIGEVLALLRQREAEHGPAIMDREFAADVAEAHELWNQPLSDSKWN